MSDPNSITKEERLCDFCHLPFEAGDNIDKRMNGRMHTTTTCARKLKRHVASLESQLAAAQLDAGRKRDALSGVAIMLNTALKEYDDEPWAKRVRAAITGEARE